MKLQNLVCALCLSGLITQFACDGASSRDGQQPTRAEAPSTPPKRLSSNRMSAIDEVRDRAEGVFANSTEEPTRFETRIGLQPWPEDLSSRWPRPVRARVLADTHQNEGGRLLLIDLPDSPAQALASYRAALIGRGFDVVRSQTPTSGALLHARLGEDEAMLTFFARESSTRLEILFLDRGAG